MFGSGSFFDLMKGSDPKRHPSMFSRDALAELLQHFASVCVKQHLQFPPYWVNGSSFVNLFPIKSLAASILNGMSAECRQRIFLHLKPMFGTMGKHSTVNISHLLAASCLLLPHSSATQPPYLLLKDYAHITLNKN